MFAIVMQFTLDAGMNGSFQIFCQMHEIFWSWHGKDDCQRQKQKPMLADIMKHGLKGVPMRKWLLA